MADAAAARAALKAPAPRWWPWRAERARSLPRQIRDLPDRPDRLDRFLFEQPGIGFLAVDRAGAILRANATMRALLGSDADLAPGAPAILVFAEAERELAAAALADCLRGGAARSAFATVLRGGATVAVTALALREPDGMVGAALLRLSDLSAQRELELQLAQAQKMQAVGQLAGGIAHDFNNLLTAVLGAAESAATVDDLPEEVLDDLAQIRASAGRGAALVRQLLAFGRQQTLQPRALALNDAVSSVSGLLRRLLGSRIRLDLELDPAGGQARADPTQLDQVLVNLAVNARDAMPDGGVLTVRTGHLTLLRTRTLGSEAIPPGRYVMIEVADTGSGIAPDILPRIFDPFFTTRREHGGTGLGLSTVHGIIRQSEGFLEVESAPGEGTRFRIHLPRAEDRAMSIPLLPASPTPVSASASKGVVLLVDDEEPVRRMAQRALTRAGWQVLAAEGGEQALAALAPDMMPAALVTDMAMHGMDGIQVLRAVRARLARPFLPVLLVSGYAEASLRDALAGEARVALLAKPYELAELIQALEQLVAGVSADQDDLTVAMSQSTNIN